MMLTYRGETKTLDEWSKIVGINKKAIWFRLKNHGWTVEDALEIPIKGMNKTRIWNKRIDNGVEAWQEMMITKGYFTKQYWNKIYKQLNTWYKEFRAQDMKAA